MKKQEKIKIRREMILDTIGKKKTSISRLILATEHSVTTTTISGDLKYLVIAGHIKRIIRGIYRRK